MDTFVNSTFLIDSKCKLVISNFTISKIIREMGGSISFTLNSKVNLIVTNSSNYFLDKSSSILANINQSKIKLISDSYFNEISKISLDMRCNIDIEKYYISNSDPNPKSNSISNSVQNIQKEDDPLKIVFNPKYVPSVCYNQIEKQPYFPDDYLILKSNLLSNTFIGHSNSVNKFYYLELNQSTDNNLKQYYRIFSQNGRTDEINKSSIQHRYSDNLEEAMLIYSSIYSQKIEDNNGYKEVSMDFIKIGSKKKLEMTGNDSKQISRTKIYCEETGEEIEVSFQGSYIEKNLSKFIELIYEEASKCLIKSYSVNVTENGIETMLGTLSIDQINDAQNVLKEINQVLGQNLDDNTNELRLLSSKYFQIVPSKISNKNKISSGSIINSIESLVQHVELLDMMKDLTISFNKTKVEYQSKNHLDMKYYALKTEMQYLHNASVDYSICMRHFRKMESHDSINVVSIFKISNQTDAVDFNGESVGNCQYLYHSSKLSNYVGILKRGLLVPDLVVKKGGKRHDFGFLGNGIYFHDEVSNSSNEFTYPTKWGTKLVIMSLVALGQVKEYNKMQPSLTSAPSGYQSCKANKSTKTTPTEFKQNEYVVYNSNQIKLSFIIEYK